MDIKSILNNVLNRDATCFITSDKDSRAILLCGVIAVDLCEDENQRFQKAFANNETHARLVDLDTQVQQFPYDNMPTMSNQVKFHNLKTRRASAAAQLASEIVEYLDARKGEHEAESVDVPQQEVAAKI
jgi:hypothetical protein